MLNTVYLVYTNGFALVRMLLSIREQVAQGGCNSLNKLHNGGYNTDSTLYNTSVFA